MFIKKYNIIKYTFLYILILFINRETFGQIKIAYTMNILSNSLLISTNTNPLTINSNNCLKVTNGINKFLISNTGEFNEECKVNLNNQKISFKILPNPFKDYIQIKSLNKILNNKIFKITIINQNGIIIKTMNINEDILNYGYKINLSNQPSGIFFLNIISDLHNESYKILKIE